MLSFGKLVMVTRGDRELELTRKFDAPPDLLFDAFTKPALVRQWMLGPDDKWTMPVCEIDLRPGGRARYEWRSDQGETMGLSSVFVEVDPPRRLVHRERFDDDWTGGEVEVVSTFTAEGDACVLKMVLTYPSADIRDAVASSGMGDGMEAGYAKIDDMLAESKAP